MIQNRTKRRWVMGLAVGASMAFLAGCGSSKAARVDDSMIARIPEDQLGGVRDAQMNRTKAADSVTRAEVAVRDAERESEVARRNADASKSRMEAEKAAVKAAEATGQANPIAQAKSQLQGADAGLAAARAEVAWHDRKIETKKAHLDLSKAELNVAERELSLARYEALQKSGDVRAKDMSEAEFMSALAEAKRDVENARRRVDEQTRVEKDARAQWQQLRSQTPQGYGGSGDAD
jgi:colicin import membrane protein